MTGISRMDVLKAIHDPRPVHNRHLNTTSFIRDRLPPTYKVRVPTVLRSLWGAGMVERSENLVGYLGYEWNLTDLGRERRDDDQG